MMTVASATQAIATQSSAELELGAHVAGTLLRAESAGGLSGTPDPSRLSEAVVPG